MSTSWNDLLKKREDKLDTIEKELKSAQDDYATAKAAADKKKLELDKQMAVLATAQKNEKLAEEAATAAKKTPKEAEAKKKVGAAEKERVIQVKATLKVQAELDAEKKELEKLKTAVKVVENRYTEEKKQLDFFKKDNQNRIGPTAVPNLEKTEAAYFAEIEKLHLGMGDTIVKINKLIEPLQAESDKIAKKLKELNTAAQALEDPEEFKSIKASQDKLTLEKGILDGKRKVLETRRDTYIKEKTELKAQLGSKAITKEKYDMLKKRAQAVLKG